MAQQNEYKDKDVGQIILEIHTYGHPPVEVAIPADATGQYAAKLVSKYLGINAGTWTGLRLVTNSGEKIPPEANISPWNGHSVRLCTTHSSVLTGK